MENLLNLDFIKDVLDKSNTAYNSIIPVHYNSFELFKHLDKSKYIYYGILTQSLANHNGSFIADANYSVLILAFKGQSSTPLYTLQGYTEFKNVLFDDILAIDANNVQFYTGGGSARNWENIPEANFPQTTNTLTSSVVSLSKFKTNAPNNKITCNALTFVGFRITK